MEKMDDDDSLFSSKSNDGAYRHKLYGVIKTASSSCHANEEQDAKENNQSFECDDCGKQLNSRANLKRHKMVHTGEKPYECDVCTKSFASKSQLTLHYRVHTGEKPYQCDVCDKKFSSRTILTRHMQVHSKEKSYACDDCGKCFSLKSNLSRHKQVLHADSKKSLFCGLRETAFPAGNIISKLPSNNIFQPFSSERFQPVLDLSQNGKPDVTMPFAVYPNNLYEPDFVKKIDLVKRRRRNNASRNLQLLIERHHKCKQLSQKVLPQYMWKMFVEKVI